MANALAPLSILLSFVMGMVALDDAPMELFAPTENGDALLHASDLRLAVEPVTIASKPPGARFFVLEAEVNGVPTHFLVDTAATTTVLRRSDADAAAVAPLGTTRLQTANGKIPVERASIETLTISGIPLWNVEAVVADDSLPHSLIGLDALQQMGSIIIDGSSMTVVVNDIGSSD
ncbi:retropepsin-like aspartic protease family protein [Aurantiacibacter flavus]|uniref:Retropepsin-like aspartic protease n=1 Tax=Aurantiacibacter flavus TaxID=3145232 RepID=A0ABV0CYW6_9SPHN